MNTLIAPENVWPVWALIVVGTAISIYLEQTRRWAAKISGPVLALLVGISITFGLELTGLGGFDSSYSTK